MDPNNPWPETSYSHWIEYSEYVETPYSESDVEALNQRLWRFHNPSPDSVPPTSESHQTTEFDQKNPSEKSKSEHQIENDSSSGETLVPNTPPEELLEDGEVVQDTRERPGYVEPKPDAEYLKWSVRRRSLRRHHHETPDESQFDQTPQESESWVDVEHDLDFLLQKQE